MDKFTEFQDQSSAALLTFVVWYIAPAAVVVWLCNGGWSTLRLYFG